MPIDLRVEGGEELVRVGRLSGKLADFVTDGVVKESGRFGLDAVARAKKDYLSGPRPDKLGVVTGRLRSSVAGRVNRDGPDVEVEIGTNVEYAAVHELGFRGTINVPAHVRVVNKVFGRSVPATTASVRAHSRRVNLDARPFIRPAIADAIPAFEASLENMLRRVNFEAS